MPFRLKSWRIVDGGVKIRSEDEPGLELCILGESEVSMVVFGSCTALLPSPA